MNRFVAPVRVLLCALVAVFIALASLSVATSPAQGDSNEGATNINPDNRPRQGTISAGYWHTCAVIGVDKTVWCWGNNATGELGNGSTTSSKTPVKVSGLSGVRSISVGFDHTCALLVNGVARCWGNGATGQLGNGGTALSSVPVPVVGGHVYTTISAGKGFTCGTTSTQVLCWGSNGKGQLGTGAVGGQSPTPVAANVGPSVVVSAGTLHTCAIASGTGYCWGENTYGQLGLGYTSSFVSSPTQVIGVFNASAISAGDKHTCSIGGGGTKCWGDNFIGKLGNGSQAPAYVPTNIANGNTLDQAISAGGYHTCSRIPANVRCWGYGGWGALGNGSTNDSFVPVTVSGHTGETPAITTGDMHTCVQYQVGSVDCFGQNTHGQIGDGTLLHRAVPVRILGLPSVPLNTYLKPGPGQGQLTVSWSSPANTGGTPIKNYRIQDPDKGIDVLVPGNLTSHTLSGLTTGQSYQLDISAINEIGEGPLVQRTPFTLTADTYVEIGNTSLVEGNSGTKVMTFTITRFGKTSNAVSVKAATKYGTVTSYDDATPPSDYTAKAATLVSFAAGQTTKTFTVSTRGDLLAEDDEKVYVTLTSPVGTGIWGGDGVGTIVNDDPGGKPHYTINNVNKLEGNTGTSLMAFTITRSGSTAVAGSVKYFTQSIQQAAPTADYTTVAPTLVNFPVGVTTKTVNVTIKGDLVAESDEYFQVTLKDPVNGSIDSFPTGYGQILNDDSSAPTTIAINDVSFDEGDGYSKNVTFTITRSGNLAGTTGFKFATANGTAIAPGDYAARALTALSFTPGQTVKTVAITVRGGVVAEPDEEFYVLLSAVTGGSISDASGTGLIINDD